MKSVLGFLTILTLTSIVGTESKKLPQIWKKSDFVCTISALKDTIKLGEVPEMVVSIMNNSSEDVLMIGSLDGSDAEWRFPYCTYTMEWPTADRGGGYGRCGNMNALREEDFVRVKAGESFNPYMDVVGNGFFGSSKIRRKSNFRNVGTYKIQFHYNSNSNDIEKYFGAHCEPENKSKFKRMLKKVPKIKLESNVIEVTVIDSVQTNTN